MVGVMYALGVVLYLILTGEMPHSFDGQPIFEAMRVIREDFVGLQRSTPTSTAILKPSC